MKNQTTQVVRCTCKHEQQDAIYGKGLRLANKCEKATVQGFPAVRCTVCSTLHRSHIHSK